MERDGTVDGPTGAIRNIAPQSFSQMNGFAKQLKKLFDIILNLFDFLGRGSKSSVTLFMRGGLPEHYEVLHGDGGK